MEELMTICIPTISDDGATARLSPHYGRAPFYMLVDVGAASARAIPNPRADHRSGRCEVTAAVEGRPIEAVVCRGMGAKAFEQLRAHGVTVLSTEAWTVADAVRAFREGRLRLFTPDAAARHRHE
jgi:predicted Fe-Mo cluster-binding NifX family protein